MVAVLASHRIRRGARPAALLAVALVACATFDPAPEPTTRVEAVQIAQSDAEPFARQRFRRVHLVRPDLVRVPISWPVYA